MAKKKAKAKTEEKTIKELATELKEEINQKFPVAKEVTLGVGTINDHERRIAALEAKVK